MQLIGRDLKLLIRGMVPALLLACLLLLVCGLAGLSAFRASTELTVPAAVALVDEEDSLISRFCIGMVESADYVDKILSIEKCGRDEASAGLEEGRFAAAIILPEDYTDRIMHGESCTGTVILSEKAASMSDMVARASALGERLLAAGQYGVFAGEDLIWSGEGGADGDYSQFLAISNSRLIDSALELENQAFETVILPYSGFGTDTTSHFMLCWACAFASLCGLFFSALYNTDRGEEIRDRLRSCGVGTCRFMAGKVLWPFVFRCILWCVVLAVAVRLAGIEMSAGATLCVIAGLLLCTCFTTGLCLAFPKGASWIVLLLCIAGMFLCGALVPLQFIPSAFFSAGRILPIGAMAGVMSPQFGGRFSASSFVILVLWAAAAMVCAYLKLERRQGKEDME